MDVRVRLPPWPLLKLLKTPVFPGVLSFEEVGRAIPGGRGTGK